MVMREQQIENKNFIIQIKGLKIGKYEYDFPVDGAFFREFENTQILDASLDVRVVLERGGGWMNLTSSIKGTVTVECDRCLDDLDLPVDFNANLSVKFAKSDEDPQSDEFLVVDPSDGELDLSQFIYDYVCVNLPLQKVHEEGKCNPQMIARLGGLDADNDNHEDNLETNSPFGALADMLKHKK